MKTLKSFAEIVKMAESSEVYVRWSRGPAMDKRRGYSLDYTNYRAHNGLSAQRVNPTDYSASTVAMMLVEYIFLKGKDARIFGWLCTAESNGTDSDGAPTIDAESIVPVGRLADGLVEALARYNDDYWLAMRKPATHPTPDLQDYLGEYR